MQLCAHRYKAVDCRVGAAAGLTFLALRSGLAQHPRIADDGSITAAAVEKRSRLRSER